ncbi:S1C family serine protease [Paenibacillus sacheonensis]|uniref:Trypsin-like serine protease n=1 Tax=Paenibacillus sacheonensis TaxID=742054 RepID=A0A7X4YNP7_9BACL|nr:trypsin-like peptidase domain-containing protein [Paenibacillus sacheonensis]MBM7565342.1 S1-C subfamily serine protease [Paenibacillus sacheonensis]NBC69727.1 trypsin-like serine protease [Paenibacillus sacheonensis]
MDDQNKKNDFDDFFKPTNSGNGDESGDSTHKAHDAKPEDAETGKSSYYYSYGPFKPGSEEAAEQDGYGPRAASESRQQGLDAPSNAQPSAVEVTPPTQLRSFAPSQSARGGWQPKEKRRSPFKAMFASFLVGVIAVGSLMYVSDRENWFTSEQALVQQSNTADPAVGSAGDNGSVSTAADVVRPNNIAQLFEKASPAVVKIETFTKQQQSGGQQGSMDDFFSQFFGDDGSGDQGRGQGNGGRDDGSQGGQGSGELTPEGIGTGFFFDSTGYILTNQHVVADADEIQVTVQGYSKPFVAKKLGSDYNLDLAVLKVENTKAFPTLPIGSSDKINIGDWVVAIGNPYGFDHTVTVGVLSSKERPITIPDSEGTRQYQHLLQTDASINPGNSGGPLLNLNGEVIGINTAVSSQAQGIGFAIPTSTITEVLENLKSNKEIPKAPVPFIGATLAEITEPLAKELGLNSTDGSVVSDIMYKSPAYMADLRQYDVISGIDGKKYNREDLIATIQKKKVGDVATLNIIRNGQKMDLKVTIGNKNDFATQQQ